MNNAGASLVPALLSKEDFESRAFLNVGILIRGSGTRLHFESVTQRIADSSDPVRSHRPERIIGLNSECPRSNLAVMGLEH